MKFTCNECRATLLITSVDALPACRCGANAWSSYLREPKPHAPLMEPAKHRYEICKACKYSPDGLHCDVLRDPEPLVEIFPHLQGKKPKPGVLMHPKGLPNPNAVCPIGLFGSYRTVALHGPFFLPEETIPRPTSRFCIVCVAAGERVQEHHAITRESHERYASWIGADYRVLSDDRCPRWPLANKTRASRYAAEYDRTVIVDADVYIKPNAPDIFANTPSDKICVHDEWPDQNPEMGTQWIANESVDVAISQGLDPTPINWEPNCGVIVLPRSLAYLFHTPKQAYPNWWCAEQHYLALCIREAGVGYHNLDPRWNWCSIRSDFEAGWDKAYFIHPNAVPHEKRLDILRVLATQYG